MVDILENVPFFKKEQTEKIQEMGPWKYQFFSVSNRFKRRAFKACPGFIMFRCSRKKKQAIDELGIRKGKWASGIGQRATGKRQRATSNGEQEEK